MKFVLVLRTVKNGQYRMLMGDKLPKHGDYTASFALHAGFDRKINAVLTALTPLGAPAAAPSK